MTTALVVLFALLVEPGLSVSHRFHLARVRAHEPSSPKVEATPQKETKVEAQPQQETKAKVAPKIPAWLQTESHHETWDDETQHYLDHIVKPVSFLEEHLTKPTSLLELFTAAKKASADTGASGGEAGGEGEAKADDPLSPVYILPVDPATNPYYAYHYHTPFLNGFQNLNPFHPLTPLLGGYNPFVNGGMAPNYRAGYPPQYYGAGLGYQNLPVGLGGPNGMGPGTSPFGPFGNPLYPLGGAVLAPPPPLDPSNGFPQFLQTGAKPMERPRVMDKAQMFLETGSASKPSQPTATSSPAKPSAPNGALLQKPVILPDPSSDNMVMVPAPSVPIKMKPAKHPQAQLPQTNCDGCVIKQ